MNFEYGMGGKWLELLKQVAPNVTRAAGSGAMQFAAVNRPGFSGGHFV
jgi:hypothetical protein